MNTFSELRDTFYELVPININFDGVIEDICKRGTTSFSVDYDRDAVKKFLSNFPVIFIDGEIVEANTHVYSPGAESIGGRRGFIGITIKKSKKQPTHNKIKGLVPLSFDPENSGDEIRKIFSDDLARTLWLAIKQSHLTDQHFNKLIVKYARDIEAAIEKGKLDADKLFRILSPFAKPAIGGVIGPKEQEFAEELLPFVTGEKAITFKVETA